MTTTEIRDFLVNSHIKSPVFIRNSVQYQGYFFMQKNPDRCILYLDYEQFDDHPSLHELLYYFENYS